MIEGVLAYATRLRFYCQSYDLRGYLERKCITDIRYKLIGIAIIVRMRSSPVGIYMQNSHVNKPNPVKILMSCQVTLIRKQNRGNIHNNHFIIKVKCQN